MPLVGQAEPCVTHVLLLPTASLQHVCVERLQDPPQSRTVAPELEPASLPPLLDVVPVPLLLELDDDEADPEVDPEELFVPPSSVPSSPVSGGLLLLLHADAIARTTALALIKKGPDHRVS
jgi:hypothetical protein